MSASSTSSYRPSLGWTYTWQSDRCDLGNALGDRVPAVEDFALVGPGGMLLAFGDRGEVGVSITDGAEARSISHRVRTIAEYVGKVRSE